MDPKIIEVQEKLAAAAKEQFVSKNRNLFACIRMTVPEFWTSCTAILQLNPEWLDELEMRRKTIVQQDWRAADTERDSFKAALYRMAAESFIKLQKRGKIELAIALTPEAERELEDLEILAGERDPRPELPLVKTAAQILEETVIEDFAHLPGDKFRVKVRGDAAYRQMYEHLSTTGKLTLRATTNTNLSGVGH